MGEFETKRSKKPGHDKEAKMKKNQQPRTNPEGFKQGVGGKSKVIEDAIERAKRELVRLTGFGSANAVGAKKEGDGWILLVQIVEKESIPDGMDVLGTYEVQVDENGGIRGYKRTDLRKRVDTTFARAE